jgi:hypothetical protein
VLNHYLPSQDLNVYHLRITIGQLRGGVAKRCAACALLQEGIGYFAEPDHDIAWLDLLVDCAIYVTLLGKNERRLYTVEFYTDIGKLFLCSTCLMKPVPTSGV